jgi:sugar lactone lactonase YvrE
LSERAELRLDCGNELGESPVWCESSGTLYWINVTPGRVYQWKPRSDRFDFWEFGGLVTGLNLVRGGGLLVHGRDGLWRLDPASGVRSAIFNLPPAAGAMRFNDGHCDPAGRLWVGTTRDNIDAAGEALTEALVRDGRLYVVEGAAARAIDERLGCPNGICWSPDGRRFYMADSCDGWLYDYSFDSVAGAIQDKRPFFRLEGCGVPDGAAVDCEGNIWNARWGAGAVIRISPDGALDRLVRLPVSLPTACCFGDDDRRTLYVTSARFSLQSQRLQAEPLAGGLFSLRVDVPGADTHAFAPGD